MQQSKRARTKVDRTNIGPESRRPSRQIGAAQSSISPLSSTTPMTTDDEGAVRRIIGDLVGILKVHPEHHKTVHGAVDLIKKQVMQIECLKNALGKVRTELTMIVGGLEGEELKIITALHDMILDVLDMVDDEAEESSAPATLAFSSTAPPSSTSPPSSASSSSAPRETTRHREGKAALEGLKNVARLEAKGKMAKAAEKLKSLPTGKHVGEQTISNAGRAMESLLFQLGGLDTIRRVLDSFFARPAVRTAMSNHLKSKTKSHDDAAVDSIINTAKAFFTGIMGTKGRRSDIDMNAFWAAAAAMVPVTAREDKLVRAVMRILGLRYESVKRAIELRKAMVDTAAGWKWIKTKEHWDRTDWTPLEKWLHSDEASTPDNDKKCEIKVNVRDDGATVSYEVHERRYWNDKFSVLRENFRTTPAFNEMQKAHIERERSKRHTKAIRLAKLKHGQQPSPQQVEN